MAAFQSQAAPQSQFAERPLDFAEYLEWAKRQALQHIRRLVAGKDPRFRPILYDLVLDYPARLGKGLRPALCIAACRAFGGDVGAVVPTAAVLELYHNAFLIHDDVEDGSQKRRGAPTLHRLHGLPIAVNTGDAMLALALRPLLDNLELIGLGKTLRILDTVTRMAEESAEGQALELNWIRGARWNLTDSDYVEMVAKKTAWYSFIAPLVTGATIAGVQTEGLTKLERFGRSLGIAFQIQDDLLNIDADERAYGKESCGDLWEGKHTLILLKALRAVSGDELAMALKILATPREAKGEGDVGLLLDLIRRSGACEATRRVAHSFIEETRRAWGDLESSMPPSVHRNFLLALVQYVVERER